MCINDEAVVDISPKNFEQEFRNNEPDNNGSEDSAILSTSTGIRRKWKANLDCIFKKLGVRCKNQSSRGGN